MKKFPISFILLLTILPHRPSPYFSDIIGNLMIPPLKKGVTQTIQFTYQSYTSGRLKLTVVLNHESYPNIPIYQLQQDVGTGYFPIQFTLSGELTILRDTMLTIVANKNDKTVSKTVYISMMDQQTIYPQHSGSEYTSYGSIAWIDALGRVNQIKERFLFESFDPFIEQSYSLSFPLERFSIEHNLASLGYPLSLLPAEFLFEDRYHIFPRLPKVEQSNVRRLPLRYQLEGGRYHFYFDTPLYVDKQTRMMSLKPEIGFHLTNKLFFPINHHDEVMSFSYRLKLFGVGVNANQIDFQGVLYSKYRYFGDYTSSYYSVSVMTTDIGYSTDLKEIIIHE